MWDRLGLTEGRETDTRAQVIKACTSEFIVKGSQEDLNWLSNSFLSELLRD